MVWETLQLVFDAFGSIVFVPIILAIVALVLGAGPKKSFQAALFAGVGLVGFNFITSGFTPVVTPVVQRMVEVSGINLPVLDIGWQAIAAVAYSTQVGMMYIGIGILWQLILFFTRFTPIFMPSDLWNNYSFIVWGSMIYQITENIWLALATMLFSNAVILIFSEIYQKRWVDYYGYEGTIMTAPHHTGSVPIIIALDWVLSKVGANKIVISSDKIEEKMGFLGEPMTIGLMVGFLIGFLGNLNRLGTIQAWAEMTKVAITTAAVMAIFPRVAGIFANAFAILTDASKKKISQGQSRNFYIAVNDAIGYGESATLTTGLLMIPIALLLAFILPFNLVIPVLVLTGFPYKSEIAISITNGNIFKSLIITSIIFGFELWVASMNAPIITSIAQTTGLEIPAGAMMVVGFTVSNPILFLIFRIFLTQNYILIAITIVVFVVFYVWYRKNKDSVDTYLDNQAKASIGHETLEEAL